MGGLTNLIYLDLRCNPLTNAGQVLPGLAGLTTLYLGGTGISNVSFLQTLTQLTFLNLDHNEISDLSPLVGLWELRDLDISYNPVTNAVPEGPFPYLNGLYLSGLSLSNIAVLAQVSGLASLTLCNNHIEDLGPLAAMTGLRDLGLSGNPAADYSPVAALTNLATLWLEANSVSNLAFVRGLTALKALNLRQNHLSNLEDLSGLAELRAVLADHNRLTDIASLQSLPGLSRGQLTGNVLDLSAGSSALTTIQYLESHGATVIYLPQDEAPTISAPLSFTSATNTALSFKFEVGDDFTPGDQLVTTARSSDPNLIPNEGIEITVSGFNRFLTLSPAPDQSGTVTLTLTVTDQSGAEATRDVQVNVVVPQPVAIADPQLDFAVREALSRMTGTLTSVDLARLSDLGLLGRSVGTLDGLEWAVNLAVLYLDASGTTNLTALQSLNRLSFLRLGHNAASDWPAVGGLTNLSGLRLDGNYINDLAFLQNLTGLSYLNLNDNLITDLSPIGGLTNLEVLSLKGNLLIDLLPIQDLPRLVELDVRMNVLDTGTNSPAMNVIQSLQSRGVEVAYSPQRGPPHIQAPFTWRISTDETAVMFFTVEPNGYSNWVAVAASSSNTNLLPDANVLVGKYGAGWWTLTVTPNSTQTGASTITFNATNDLGFSNRWDMVILVAAPLPFNGQVVNPNFVWQTGAAAPWFGQSTNSHDGDSAARSGVIKDDMQTWVQTTLSGPGILSFWWKVSSETNRDWLECYVDGVPQAARISGEVDWQQQEIVIPTLGTHSVRWQYAKSFQCCKSGQDAAWLDQVTFTPLSWLELPAGPTNGQSALILHPVADRLYEVQASSNLTNWFRLAFLVPTNNPMPFVDVAAPFGQRFYRLHEFARSSIWLEPPVTIGNQVRLILHSPPDLRFELQASTNLVDWTGLVILTNEPGLVEYAETMSTNSPWRFYRARLLLP